MVPTRKNNVVTIPQSPNPNTPVGLDSNTRSRLLHALTLAACALRLQSQGTSQQPGSNCDASEIVPCSQRRRDGLLWSQRQTTFPGSCSALVPPATWVLLKPESYQIIVGVFQSNHCQAGRVTIQSQPRVSKAANSHHGNRIMRTHKLCSGSESGSCMLCISGHREEKAALLNWGICRR